MSMIMKSGLVSTRERNAEILARMYNDNLDHCSKHPHYKGYIKPQGEGGHIALKKSDIHCVGCWEVYLRNQYLLIDKKAQQLRTEKLFEELPTGEDNELAKKGP